jgi:hypothetical protein
MSKLNEEWKVEPHGELIKIAEGIWSVEGVIKMPLGKFPRRMTVIALASGKLAIWSPISLGEAEMTKLDALGPVGFLIVPNAAHRLDLRSWKSRFPDALVVASRGAVAAVGEAAAVDATENVLADAAVAFEHVEGTKADEFALVARHDDGATLIINDILSSVSHPEGIGTHIMARLDIVRRVRLAGIASVQNAYSLVDRQFDDLLHFCTNNGIAWAPFFPLGGATPGMAKVTEQPEVIAVANRLAVTPSQVGLAWLLQKSGNILRIPGTSSIPHLEENCAAGSVVLDEGAIRELEAIGMARAESHH